MEKTHGWRGTTLPLCLCFSLMVTVLLPLILVAVQVNVLYKFCGVTSSMTALWVTLTMLKVLLVSLDRKKVQEFSFLVCLMMRTNETMTHCWLSISTRVVCPVLWFMYHCTSGGCVLIMSMGNWILHSRVWGSPEIGANDWPLFDN